MSVSVKKGFKEEDFARLHPGGKLGKKFLKVRDLMHTGDEVPRVDDGTAMKDVIYEMSRKGLGLTTVQDHGRWASRAHHRWRPAAADGDAIRTHGADRGQRSCTAAAPVSLRTNSPPPPSAFSRKNASLRSWCATAGAPVLGVLHLHDLWGVGLF